MNSDGFGHGGYFGFLARGFDFAHLALQPEVLLDAGVGGARW